MYGGRCHGERLGRLDLESGSSNTLHCRAFTAIGDYSRVSGSGEARTGELTQIAKAGLC